MPSQHIRRLTNLPISKNPLWTPLGRRLRYANAIGMLGSVAGEDILDRPSESGPVQVCCGVGSDVLVGGVFGAAGGILFWGVRDG